MRVADTSFLYAFLNADDHHHAEATQAMRDPETILVPRPAWYEFLGLVQYRAGHAAATAAKEYLDGRPNVRVHDDLSHHAAGDLWVGDRQVGLTDAAVIVAAIDQRAQLLSFDEAQLTAWQKAR